MTDAPLAQRLVRHPVTVWAGFVVVHIWLEFLGLYGPGLPLGDVTLVYRFWVEHGLQTGDWVGIDTVWVYPIVALVPMLVAYVFGPDLYPTTWLSLVMLVDAVAFAVLTVWLSIACSYQLNWPVGFFVGAFGALGYGIGQAFSWLRSGRLAGLGRPARPAQLVDQS